MSFARPHVVPRPGFILSAARAADCLSRRQRDNPLCRRPLLGSAASTALALSSGMFFAVQQSIDDRDRTAAARRPRNNPRHLRGCDMDLFDNIRRRHIGVALAGAFAAVLTAGSATAQTAIKFSLDFKFEGPAAPFVVAI